MSEPMSTHEIEDVLSSIRRLVSEDLRPASKPDAPAPSAAAKLILTPALRVADSPVRTLAAELPQQPGPEAELALERPPEPEDNPSDSDMQDVVARLGAAVGEGDEQWESPLGDPPAWDDVTLAPPARDEDAPSAHGRLHFNPTEEDQEDPPASFYHAGSADLTQDDPSRFDMPDFAEAEPVEEPLPPPRRMVTPPQDDWAEAAEAEVRAKLDREIEEDTQSMFATVDNTFDEEVLRDLVRDIIREELAGSLGERITRNVRKLVRAEIARALAVREFE